MIGVMEKRAMPVLGEEIHEHCSRMSAVRFCDGDRCLGVRFRNGNNEMWRGSSKMELEGRC